MYPVEYDNHRKKALLNKYYDITVVDPKITQKRERCGFISTDKMFKGFLKSIS